jgi:ferredoxin
MPITIDYDKCCWKDEACKRCSCSGECTGCITACPVEAITRDQKVEIDNEKCTECGVCITACPSNALSFK